MKKDTLCPIARACSIIADTWTILILRELRLGNDRFDGIQAQTGISSHLLAQRLKAMEADGLIDRTPLSERSGRYAYGLTDKARELDGMMLFLRQWGMRHGDFDPGAESAVTMVHAASGQTIDEGWQIPAGDAPFSFAQVQSRINPAWAQERDARGRSFNEEKRRRVRRRVTPSTSEDTTHPVRS